MTSRVLRSLPWPRATVSVVWRAVAVLCFAEFVRTGVYGAFLPLFGPKVLGLNATAVALAFSVHFGADTVARSLGGHLVGRFGLRPLAVVGTLVTLGVLLTLPHVATAWELMLLAAVHGVAFSPLWPGVMTLASSNAAPDEQARATSFTQMAIFPFIGISFLGIGELASLGMRLGQTSVAWLTLVLAGFLPVLFLLGRKWEIASVRRASTATSVREAAPPTPPRTKRALAVLLPVAVMQTLGLTLLSPILLKFAVNAGLGTLGLAIVIGIGAGTAYLLLSASGRLADRRGARPVLVLGLVLIGLGFAFIATLPPLWAYFAIAALVGVGYSLMMPGWLGLVAKMLPEKERATRWGVIMTAENVGTTVGPLIGGFAWDAFGMRGPFLVGAGLFTVMTIVYLFWKPRV
ncbi:MFS transporter [Deinococcus yavapaiensis]|uniref:MFS transporter n=1 Tax=Deinococcus yavapaiensis KR-236 TaxID=694435 RepID=A0A318SQU5_9DEIO|nr:MFS transporter [Deinococcus yavapaiensis]PYE55273.1 MFS transporter [Deinococcus yavapaiensis KR-236]